MCMTYGSFDEIQQLEYSDVVIRAVSGLYDVLPLAAVVQDSIFCVHGGLSPFLATISEIEIIKRPVKTCANEIELQNELVCDLLWSDFDELAVEFLPNPRGAGRLFGLRQVESFLTLNKLHKIVLAGSLVENGYKRYGNGVVTVLFSTPDFKGLKNGAAVLNIGEAQQFEFITFGSHLDE